MNTEEANRLPGCESVNHTLCYGEMWQCSACGKSVCYAEGTDVDPDLCDDCWSNTNRVAQANANRRNEAAWAKTSQR